MVKAPFIWLGAGRAKKRGVARCGRYLDEVARAGLPVPDGAILLDELFRIFLQEGVVEQVGDKVVVPNPLWLLEVLYRDVRFPRMAATAEVRPIPADDDDGCFAIEAAIQGIDLEDADQVAAALRKAWSSPVEQNEFRRDLLIVKQVSEQTSGRALLLQERAKDEITIVSAGEEEVLSLPRLNRWQRPFDELPPFARRLQMLLRGLRRTLGRGDWDINWVDDGEICWIVFLSKFR